MPRSRLEGAAHPYHVPSAAVPWTDYSDSYPAEMMQTMRAKRIVGPGGAIEHDETVFGVLELDPGAAYPRHRHAAPEIYYVIEGKAECVFGDETFTVGPGSTIRTPPNAWHSFRNTGTGRFFAVAYWWAPDGDTAAINAPLELADED